jgi:signal transduction histidine kinase/ligand-binding sensor domain-containing protein/CheY-like chemotaxis protein
MKFFTSVFSRRSRKRVEAPGVEALRQGDAQSHAKEGGRASTSPVPTPGRSERRAFDVADLGRPAVRVYSDKDGLPQVTVPAMAFDKRGYLWVGTQDGAAYYNGRAWTVVDMPNRTLSNWVRALLVGSDGSLWFGTYGGGLARLSTADAAGEGQWRVYDTTSGLPSNVVSSLLETVGAVADGGRTLWAGTDGGLARLSYENDPEAGRWRVYDTASGLPDNRVWSLLETRGAVADGGPRVAGDRTLWVGTGGGLARLSYENDSDAGQLRVYDTTSGLPSNRVVSLLETVGEDAPGAAGGRTLWVGTHGGLVRLSYENDPDAGQWRVYDTTSGLPNNVVLSLLETRRADGGRTLWAGTNAGLARLSTADAAGEGQWRIYDTTSGLPNNSVLSLLETVGAVADGGRGDARAVGGGGRILWAGTDGGLARLTDPDAGQWRVYDTTSGLPDNGVWSLLETVADGGRGDARAAGGGGRTLWVGTDRGGLARLSYENDPDPGRWRVYDTTSGLPHNRVVSLLETVGKEGARTLWVGTHGGGLARLPYENDPDAGQSRVYDTTSGLPNNGVVSLLETVDAVADGDSRALWAGTDGGGLARLSYESDPDAGQWRVYDTASGLPSNRVWSLLETVDEEGARNLWVGTEGGLARLSTADAADAGPWRVYDTTSGLPNNVVLSLFETRGAAGGRTLWVGTFGGVSRLDLTDSNAGWMTLSDATTPALPNNTIYQIREDARKRIYLFTNKGIARLTPKASRAPTRDDPAQFAQFDIYTFNTENGLPSLECVGGASMVDSRGRIWAGTIAGAAMFDPSEEIEDRSPKPLYVERARVRDDDGKERALPRNASLAHDENNLEFECALLSYFREADTRYRTQLVGFDRSPSEWTADYRRTYTNLPQGSYTFTVWGRDHAGNVSGPARLAFRIRPAPWRTWWAYVLYAGTLAGAGYGAVQYRLGSLEQRSEELEATVAERTTELAETVEQLRISEKQALEAGEQALEASRAKSVFLSSMSHELRTPLNAVLGFAQLMERDPRIPADQQDNLAIIRRSGEHLLGLINDVLSIAKIEAGKLTLNEQVFDLRRLLAGTQAMIRVRSEAKGLSLAIDLAPDLPRSVRGDEGKLRQVLVNLLGNAVKFTDEGGVALRVAWRDDVAAFEVEDTGQGIARQELEQIFEPFVQSESGRGAKEGTGLGLAITRSFVRLMGGDIRVTSEVGKGTIFSFEVELPASGEAEVSEQRRTVTGLAEPDGGRAAYRILVADDTPENRVLLVKLLAPVGFDVREAADGREAVEAWASWRPDLIWMDMRMPVMDGYEAVKHIREAESERRDGRTAIVALTASAFEHERERILAAGCDDLVSKPFREATIFDKLAERLGVTFVYREAEQEAAPRAVDPALIPSRLAELPAGRIAELKLALEMGDDQAAAQAVDKIREHDEALAQELRTTIKSYQFGALLELIERVRPAGSATGRSENT